MTLARRAAAELLGTAFLVMAVIGSGIAATRLSPGDVGLQLLENSIATGAALVALILALQPVSAAFNPVVTLVERALGLVDTPTAAALVAAQMLGGCLGAVVANLMFGLDAVSFATTDRGGGGVLLAEVVATFGLLLVIFGTLRSGRTEAVAFAVGAYISAAYFFTSSTSFANPAVTVARMLSDTFAGIAPPSVLPFIAMQVLGGDLGRGRGAPALPDHQKGHGVSLPTVLFVCVHNAGRSQMAAGFLKHLAGDRVEVLSAGSQPADRHQPGSGRRDGRGRHRPGGRDAEAAHGCGGRGGGRRGDHGLRGRLPVLPGQAVRGLATGRPGRPGHRGGASHPRRDPTTGRNPGGGAARGMRALAGWAGVGGRMGT